MLDIEPQSDVSEATVVDGEGAKLRHPLLTDRLLVEDDIFYFILLCLDFFSFR